MTETRSYQQVRREEGPVTDRGARRREILLRAARRVFEDRGFIETRVADIVKEAQVSHGTFYTYFDTKDSIFEAVAQDVVDSMLRELAVPINATFDFHGRVREAMRRYVVAYRPHATILGLMEQVSTFSPEMRDLLLGVREAFVDRTRRGIHRMRDSGHADPDIDAEYTAEVLGAMIEHVCYIWFSLGRDFDEERMISSLGMVWEKAMLPLPKATSGGGERTATARVEI